MQRTAKFVKYLSRQGYHPVVITKEYQGGLKDYSLLQDLGEYSRYDLPGHDWVNGKGLLGRIKNIIATRLFIPDADTFWYRKHRQRILDIINKENIEWVYTTSYPYSDHLIGLYAKTRCSNIKWIVDFRDEWTNNPYHKSQWHKKARWFIEKKMERAVLGNCDYLITNTPFMLENFIDDVPELENKSTYIPNGYDEEDFQLYQLKNQNNSKFKIIYVGSLYGRRIPDYFFEAIKELHSELVVTPETMEIEFIGHYNQKRMNRYIEDFNLHGMMTVKEYMPHDQLLESVGYANALLLIEREKNFYTGKIFEYLKMGVPILATVPIDGAAASVIYETGTGAVVDAEDVPGIKNAVRKLYEGWKENQIIYHPKEEAIRTYSRESQTKQLIQCFEKIR